MFKVECPGCKAPYQVDERRIPSSGLKMRCPKCGTSFKVDPPADPRRTGPSAVLGSAVAPPGNESAAPTAIAPPGAVKGTMLGVAPPRSAAMKGTMIGVAPAPAVRPPVPPRPGPIPPRPAPPVPVRPPAPVDLPEVAATRPALGSVDLPSVVRSSALPVPERADLPAVGRTAGIDLPSLRPIAPAAPIAAPAAPTAPAAPPAWQGTAGQSPSGLELDLPLIGGAAAAGLPAVARQRGGIDLPSISQPDLPAARGYAPEAGLPARPPVPGSKGAHLQANRLDLDLPSLGGDLPSLGGDLPSLGGDLPGAFGDLPEVGAPLPAVAGAGGIGASGLPALGASGNLPSLGGQWSPPDRPGLPAVAGSLPAVASPSLPPALSGSFSGSARAGIQSAPSLPPAAAAVFGEIDLPPAESAPPPASPSGGFGELDLMGGAPRPVSAPQATLDSLEVDPFGEAPLEGPVSHRALPSATAGAFAATDEALHRQTGGGGTDYGEVSLDGGGGGGVAEVALDAAPPGATRADDDMEFGAVPQENKARAPTAATHVAAAVGKLAAQRG